jgi:putative tryptophan/tyrosine transport system substrate-binding protein
MRRRTFIALAGGVSAWQVVARAQTPARLGYLGAGTADSYYMTRLLAGLTQGLTENGMIEGRDYLLETRFVGDYERFPTLARELQQAKVRIIIASTIAAVRAAQQLSPPIPVVMAAINDPVGTGLVASLAHPGGLTTGTATLNEDVTPKLLEFLGVLFPRAITLAALYNPANPSSVSFLPSLRRESSVRGISLIELAFASSADLGSTLSTLVAARHLDALQLLADSFVFDQADRIAALALAQRLPTLASAAEIAYAGALLAYGLSVKELYRRSAYYVKRILDEGANPADLPVEQPTRVGLVINLKTAKALGVDVPEQLLARADEVIE